MWCYHHVDLYKYTYYCYAKQLNVLWQMFHVKYSSGYTYNSVHLWFLQFPKKIVLPYNIYVFSILPFMFLWLLTYINLLLYIFSYHILFHALCLYLLHKSTPVDQSCTYTMMYCVCHLHKIYIYIWDIYISINFYCTIHFTSCSYCHHKNHTRVQNWYISWNE